MTIGDLIRNIEHNESGAAAASSPRRKFYFRALGRRYLKDRASLNDFGTAVTESFSLPEELLPNATTIHSSVLRIGSPDLELWAHYDIPDNFLVQVRGKKTVVLFPPSEVANLEIAESSSPVELLASGKPDLSRFPNAGVALRNAQVANLSPGDILFIPSCWIHAVRSLPLELNRSSGEECGAGGGVPIVISVNVFFYNHSFLIRELFERKDIYGNKDLPVAAHVLSEIDSKLLPAIRSLPEPFRTFYLLKVSNRFLSEAKL